MLFFVHRNVAALYKVPASGSKPGATVNRPAKSSVKHLTTLYLSVAPFLFVNARRQLNQSTNRKSDV